MGIVSVAFVYNAAAIPLRVTFDVYSSGWLFVWLACDYLFADVIYVTDVAFIQPHVHYRKRLDIKKMFKETEVKKVRSLVYGLVEYIVPILRDHP